MKNFRVLSLDISASSTGWAFLTNRNKKIKYGLIKTSPKISTAERLVGFRKAVIDLIIKFKPTDIVIEDTFIGPNPKVTKLLAKFGGVAEELIFSLTTKNALIVDNKTTKAFFHVKTKSDLFDLISDLLDLEKEIDKLLFRNHNDITDAMAQLLYSCDVLLKYKKIKVETGYGFKYK